MNTQALPPAASLPPCSLIGQLEEARELLRAQHWPEAWSATTTAIAARPYHPEAYLLLAQIAKAAGDGSTARLCAKTACDLAPAWAPPKQFLRGDLRGNATPPWIKLPPALCDKPAAAAPRLSVCLIVKDEERMLEKCLSSVRALAAQIIVVDTGSTDRTIEIARQGGAEVHYFPWCDDFSAARNAALEHATGDWILSLDADEELMPEQGAVIAREIQAPLVMGYRLPIYSSGHEQRGCGYVPRLFRNAPGVHYIGRIHEQAFSSLEARCQQWGLKHELGHAAILHHGFTDEVLAGRNKIERNLRLLERSNKEFPDEPNLIMHLGLELVRSGKLEAGLDRYWEAFRLISARPVSEVAPEWREEFLTQLATHLMTARRYSDIVRLWQMPFANHGGLTAAHHFSLGVALKELHEPAQAAEQIRQCLAKRDRPSFAPVPPEIHLAGPHHCLALCFIDMKDFAEARQAFDEALAAEPFSRPARFDLARFLAAQERPGEALKLLRHMAAENPDEARVWELGGQIALNRPEHLAFALDWTHEAVKHFPENLSLLSQRAEALLLHQEVAQALPLWRRAQASGTPRQRAAVVICELLTGDRQYHFTDAEEAAISLEVLQWYRHCIRMGARALIQQMHERMGIIHLVLPAFVRVLEAAHRQARQAFVPQVVTKPAPI